MRKKYERTNRKIVVSGSQIESFYYPFSYLNYGNSVKNLSRFDDEVSLDDKRVPVDNSVLCFRRSKTNCRRLIDSNSYQYEKGSAGGGSKFYPPVLMTLTTRENIQDIDVGNGIFFNFMKRLNYYYGKNLKYVSVPEFQNRGAIHFHTAVFNMGFTSQAKLLEIWAGGGEKKDFGLDIRRADKVRGLGRYLTKYMSKGFSDSRLSGHKRYHPSNNLYRPKIFYNQDKCDNMNSFLMEMTPLFEKRFVSEYLGETIYSYYDLSKNQPVAEMDVNIYSPPLSAEITPLAV